MLNSVVLFAAGIILSKSESTRYESGHSLPSMDSIAHAGHSFRPRPQQFLNATVTTTVPLLTNDTSHPQTIGENFNNLLFPFQCYMYFFCIFDPLLKMPDMAGAILIFTHIYIFFNVQL